MNAILTTLIPIASIAVGCFLMYVAWKSFSSTRNIGNWEVAQGIITKSGVKRTGTAFLADVEYQYSVFGVEYRGISVTIPPDLIFEVEAAQDLIDEYPIGKKVDVFYNPENHGVAVLEKKSPVSVLWVLWLAICTALAFLILGLAFLLDTIR